MYTPSQIVSITFISILCSYNIVSAKPVFLDTPLLPFQGTDLESRYQLTYPQRGAFETEEALDEVNDVSNGVSQIDLSDTSLFGIQDFESLDQDPNRQIDAFKSEGIVNKSQGTDATSDIEASLDILLAHNRTARDVCNSNYVSKLVRGMGLL